MDAVEYVKTQFRLCRSKDSCSECPLQDKENCCCIMDTIEYVEKAVQIVEQWAKEHPVKTRQSEFLKAYPDAKINTDTGAIAIFPCVINKKLTGEHCKKYSQRTDECDACAWDWWTEEIE